MKEFIEDDLILELVKEARELGEKDFSDIRDDEGNQYVDLVQEGGGVLGIALVGYTYILEKAGIRFFSLAGTSAGAINTLMTAGLSRIGEPVSMKILKMLSEKDLFDIVDGDKKIRKLIQKAINHESGLVRSLICNAIRIYKTLKKKLGVNPGVDFETWISGELERAGIHTLKDLKELRKKMPEGIKNISDPDDLVPEAGLAIITSEITTHTKVKFPEMAELYWEDPDSRPPAKMVRASMSIPFFFQPMEIKGLPNAGKVHDSNWDKHAKYFGEVPGSVKFVDGGMLSNFPINVFHRTDNKIPGKPTFGVRLSAYRQSYSKTDTFLRICGAMISTMRQVLDYEFILKHPDYSQLICNIDADGKFNWLNFNMSKDEQVELFRLGAQKAIEFLRKFDWEKYKQTREKLTQALMA